MFPNMVINRTYYIQPEPDILEFTEKKPNQKDFSPKIGLFEKMNKDKVEVKKKLAEGEYRKALEEYNQKFFLL